VIDFLLVLIELFSPALTLRRYEQILVKIVRLKGGWVTMSTNFRRKGVVVTKLLSEFFLCGGVS